MNIHIVIIEDEAAAARRLAKLIQEIDPSVKIVQRLDSIETSIEWLSKHEDYDLLLMDIHLADGSSFEIFEHIDLKKPVIFTTAFDEYAINAFKVNAVDYLLKPIKKNELANAINKFKNTDLSRLFDIQKFVQSFPSANELNNLNKRFLIRLGQHIKLVEIKDIAYFYTEDKITFLITNTGKRYPLDHSLEKLEQILNPQQFFRINRQFIINIDAIDELYTYSKSRVKVILSPSCELETIVSTERSPHFKKWLAGS